MSIILTVVSIVASVLQIILFFKVWGMCNDIKAIRNKEVPLSGEGEDGKSYFPYLLIFLGIIALFVIIIGVSC